MARTQSSCYGWIAFTHSLGQPVDASLLAKPVMLLESVNPAAPPIASSQHCWWPRVAILAQIIRPHDLLLACCCAPEMLLDGGGSCTGLGQVISSQAQLVTWKEVGRWVWWWCTYTTQDMSLCQQHNIDPFCRARQEEAWLPLVVSLGFVSNPVSYSWFAL